MTIIAIALALTSAILVYVLFRLSDESRRKVEKADAEIARLSIANENYHQKLRAVSESSGAGILMLNGAGIIVHSNTFAERILGSEAESMVGHALIQATLSKELQQFVAESAGGSQSQTRDFPMPGSPSRVLRASVYPLRQGLYGEPETMLVLVDVTELRKLETMRRDFVANVSHELRTPLASIRAMAETLESGALKDEQVAGKFLNTIVREADRLTRISADLLVLSDAESKEPVKELFDLAGLLVEVVNRSKPQAVERGIELSLEVSPPLQLSAARDQIEQVLVNLIDNAIKYTASGGRVEVCAENRIEDVQISVRDTGIGIMEEHLPRLFERFYRVDKARSRESGGTGLGLSIVKNIVEAHGGEVAVASQFNRGSTFTITLPKVKEAANETNANPV